jgi:DNA polymerase/3'-5' exonuclease PolX
VVDNARLAERLEGFAALLDLNGSGYYTVRAYRRAAELIRSTPADVAALVRAGRVRELAGIGPGIEARLRELVETAQPRTRPRRRGGGGARRLSGRRPASRLRPLVAARRRRPK